MPVKNLSDFFDLLSSLKNMNFCVEAPSGQNLIRFLKKKSGLSTLKIKAILEELEKMGLIIGESSGDQLNRIKISGERYFPKKRESERTFAIFMDYKNLEDNLPNSFEKLRDFSWLLDPILKVGKIIFAFVFIPDHYLTKAPVQQLANKHQFSVIACPRQVSGIVTKNADTVDTIMSNLAKGLVEHSDITDIVVISGDADFKQLVNFAIWQQKKVKVISATDAISGHYLRIEDRDKLTVDLVD